MKRKMKTREKLMALVGLLIAIVFVASGCIGDATGRLFRYPENLAQQVANKIYKAPDKVVDFNVGMEDEGKVYLEKFTQGQDIYSGDCSI